MVWPIIQAGYRFRGILGWGRGEVKKQPIRQNSDLNRTFVTAPTGWTVILLGWAPMVFSMTKPTKSENQVLVVDDSPIYQHLIAAYLREWGFKIVSATNGVEAWEILRRPGAPVLALLDWVMPGMDGVELCRKLRNQEGREGYVYTILLTAKNSRA